MVCDAYNMKEIQFDVYELNKVLIDIVRYYLLIIQNLTKTPNVFILRQGVLQELKFQFLLLDDILY